MNHEPDPAFVEHLEWQVRTSLRRRDRFARPAPRGGWVPVRTAALVLVSLLAGAGGVVAADRIQDSETRDFEVAKARVHVEMAEARYEAARMEWDEVRALVEVGVMSSTEALSASSRTAAAEAELESLLLDLEEVEMTGAAPRRDLTAPLVRGRDFVSERLQREVRAKERKFEAVREQLEQTRSLAEVGVITTEEVLAVTVENARAESELEEVLERLEIRHRFLRKEIPSERVTLMVMRSEARHRLRVSEFELKYASERRARIIERASAMRSQGESEADLERRLESDREFRRADLNRKLIEGEIQLIRLELETIERQLRGEPQQQESPDRREGVKKKESRDDR